MASEMCYSDRPEYEVGKGVGKGDKKLHYIIFNHKFLIEGVNQGCLELLFWMPFWG